MPSASSTAGERVVAAQALVALAKERRGVELLELVELAHQDGLQAHRDRMRIAMRAAERFADDLVDETKFGKTRRGEAERLGGVLGLLGALPEDRRAAFGRDHRIRRVLQHVRAVADADRERAARAAFADNG